MNKFIVIDGLDGCGKDTQVNLLAEMYEKGPHWGDVVVQRAKSIEDDLK